MDWNETRSFLASCFPETVRTEMELLQPGELREIRIRAEKPTVFITATRAAALDWQPSQEELEAVVEALSGHSLYARSDETAQGFLTLQGGHRMGLSGRVISRSGARSLTDIGSVCIRIACEWPGCADPLMPLIRHDGQIGSMLIIGLPGSGKTTLLRDIARRLASGRDAVPTGVIDERGELAACVRGVPQLDIGDHTDVLDGVGRAEGVQWLIRSMAPRAIITDELSGSEDAAAILDAQACGAAVFASVHGASLQDVAARPALAALMSRRVFDTYCLLSPEGGGVIAALHDRCGSPLQGL